MRTEIGWYGEYETVNEAWESLYGDLKRIGEIAENTSSPSLLESRDGAVYGEAINVVTEIQDPTRNFVTSPTRDLSMRYAVGELLWYLSGSNKLRDIAHYSGAWKKLSDDGETVNSAYGHRIFSKFGFNQWKHVIGLLMEDPNSRQAVIHIKEPNAEPTKDLPCTVCLQYFIRDGKLYATTYMRSNDIWLGFPYDVFTFTSLQIAMAFQLGVEIGTYTHIAGSLHLYERNVIKDAQG